MLFNSVAFLIFFPVVCCLYFFLPHKIRWLLLLISSAIFYSWLTPWYLLILALTIVVDYIAGILIEKADAKSFEAKLYLVLSIVITTLILAYFKYFNFFLESANDLIFAANGSKPFEMKNILLPIGLSFHTFQSLSYVVEVYRGNQKAETNFGIYALYVMFFPQLVAGPIERPQNMLHQFYEKHTFNEDRVTEGLVLAAWGFFKKVAVADRLALIVNETYTSPENHSGISLLLATIFFSFQIYLDFSGYTDIARGTARILGFELMKNFDRPYSSKTVSEFWRRWHISLSTWFRDYLYVPMGGNRVVPLQRNFNILFTFAVSGLWHGASWNFVIWGFLNGLFIVVGNLKKQLIFNPKVIPSIKRNAIFQVVITFTLITFSWIFFRSKNLGESIFIIKKILTSVAIYSSNLQIMMVDFGSAISKFGFSNLILSIAGILVVEIFHWNSSRGSLTFSRFKLLPSPIRLLSYYSICVITLLFGVFGESKFIYFQF